MRLPCAIIDCNQGTGPKVGPQKSYRAAKPARTRTRRNIEESDGTVIFSLERLLSGGTKLTRTHANKLGKPVLHIYDTRKERILNQDALRLASRCKP
jgi:hypothetical protein